MTEPLHLAVMRDIATRRCVDRDSPPQGHPVVAALGHARRIYEFASRSADLVSITPADDDSLRTILAEPADVGGTDVKIFADLSVSSSGWSDMRSVTTVDLPFIVGEVVPLLREACGFRTAYRQGETLRARLGLPVAENRYQEANQP